MRVVEQAVADRVGLVGVTDDGVPIGYRQLAGDQSFTAIKSRRSASHSGASIQSSTSSRSRFAKRASSHRPPPGQRSPAAQPRTTPTPRSAVAHLAVVPTPDSSAEHPVDKKSRFAYHCGRSIVHHTDHSARRPKTATRTSGGRLRSPQLVRRTAPPPSLGPTRLRCSRPSTRCAPAIACRDRRESRSSLDMDRFPTMPPSQAQVDAAEAQIVEQSKRIEFYLTEYSVELLALKMERGDFEIPGYQREDTWEPPRKHRFIESLLMGLPIPFLFFWEIPDSGRLEIVDGSQRLRTIQQFIHGNLTLGALDKLTNLKGFSFSDLPESRQRKIRNRSIRGIVLNEHADERARFDLFDRINTGSKVANKAEVRRGALGGPFIDLVIDLSKDQTFEALAPVPDAQVKMREREELVTRFFAYGDGLGTYRDRVSRFLFAYAKRMTAYFCAHPEAVDE